MSGPGATLESIEEIAYNPDTQLYPAPSANGLPLGEVWASELSNPPWTCRLPAGLRARWTVKENTGVLESGSEILFSDCFGAPMGGLFCKAVGPRKSQMPKTKRGIQAEGNDEGLQKALGRALQLPLLSVCTRPRGKAQRVLLLF